MDTKDLLKKFALFKELLDEQKGLVYESCIDDLGLDGKLAHAERNVLAIKAKIRLEEVEKQPHNLNSELVSLTEKKTVDKIYVKHDGLGLYAEISRFTNQEPYDYGVSFFKAIVLP